MWLLGRFGSSLVCDIFPLVSFFILFFFHLVLFRAKVLFPYDRWHRWFINYFFHILQTCICTLKLKIKHEKRPRKGGKKAESQCICWSFDAWGIWIREHGIKGFLCIPSSVCDKVPDEQPCIWRNLPLYPGRMQSLCTMKEVNVHHNMTKNSVLKY